MKPIKTMLTALIAAITITAIASPAALATPEWYAKKAGVYNKITTPIKVTSEGTIELSKERPIVGQVIVSCKATTTGTVGAGSTGKITEINTPPTNCKCAKGCEEFKKQEWRDLPFTTELYKEGTEIRDRITSSNGIPEWNYEVKVLGSAWFNDCGFNTNTHMTNIAEGKVEAAFDTKSTKTKCSALPEGLGEWKGSLKIKANETGVEAIKVE
jgi:hypothetical protein